MPPNAPTATNPAALPTIPGTYLLRLRLDRACQVGVGRLGICSFPPGTYAYVGSAHGPGGLRARVGRHLRPNKALHWHIDYLAAHAVIPAVWYAATPQRLECTWARTLAALDGVGVPIPGFGASDCPCAAHLFALPGDAQSAAYAALGQPAVLIPAP